MITEYTEICALCGMRKQHIHHLIGGSGRRKHSPTIPLCFECHDAIHSNGVSYKLSKIVGQLAWENEKIAQGVEPRMARVDFRRQFGTSYL